MCTREGGGWSAAHVDRPLRGRLVLASVAQRVLDSLFNSCNNVIFLKIDHILHKGDNQDVAFTERYVTHAPEWEGLTDHWPIWGTYAVHAPAQKVPKQAEVQKVR